MSLIMLLLHTCQSHVAGPTRCRPVGARSFVIGSEAHWMDHLKFGGVTPSFNVLAQTKEYIAASEANGGLATDYHASDYMFRGSIVGPITGADGMRKGTRTSSLLSSLIPRFESWRGQSPRHSPISISLAPTLTSTVAYLATLSTRRIRTAAYSSSDGRERAPVRSRLGAYSHCRQLASASRRPSMSHLSPGTPRVRWSTSASPRRWTGLRATPRAAAPSSVFWQARD